MIGKREWEARCLVLVFFKARLVLLAVPKTGTTAYASALRARADIVFSNPPELKHAPVYRYNRFLRPMFKQVCGVEPELVAVMREPISWLGSWYRYRQRPAMRGHANATHEMSFDTFVEGYLKGNRPGYANVGSQAKFLETQPNGCHVAHLFRYEAPDTLRDFLEERLQTKIETRQENVSPRMGLKLSTTIEERLRRKCAPEFERYAAISV